MSIRTACYTCVFSCVFFACAVSSGASDSEATTVPRNTVPEFANALDRSRTILEHARETNDRIYADLRSFVCNEMVERFRGANRDEGHQIDTVTAKVSFENGTEHYSDIRQNTKAKLVMSNLGGAWSEGEFGTLLRQTQVLLSTRIPIFERYDDVDGIAAAVFRMDISSDESPWDLEVKSQHCRVPFRTRVWVSDSEGEILKIERSSTQIPLHVGISEINWSVVLKEVELNGKTWLLPNTGEYTVLYDDSSHREWNLMEFSNYRRYGSEVAIRFQ